MDAKLKSAIERWKSGTPASELAAEAGVSRAQMRKSIAGALGGKAPYQAARASGAGGRIELFGGGVTKPRVAIVINDAKLPVITSGRGWKIERVGKQQFEVFTSPKGVEYVWAHPNERADLIYKSKTPGLPLARLRRADDSSAMKRARKEQKLLKRGEAALEKTRATKRAAKVAKKIRRKIN